MKLQARRPPDEIVREPTACKAGSFTYSIELLLVNVVLTEWTDGADSQQKEGVILYSSILARLWKRLDCLARGCSLSTDAKL